MTANESGKESYHHGDLRQAILEAACQHLRTQNTDSLSLRALARKIGVELTPEGYINHDDRHRTNVAGIYSVATISAEGKWEVNLLR